MLKIASLVALTTFTAFLGGYAASIRSHGDWVMMRDTSGNCAAYDPARQKFVGHWQAGEDRCHMSDFIWKQIVEKPEKTVYGWF